MTSSTSAPLIETSGETYESGEFKTVVFSVKNDHQFRDDIVHAWETGESKGYAEHSFPTAERLFDVISSKRWDILGVMAGAGGLSIREVARRVGRDVKAVHGDVIALLSNGVIDRGASGKIIFPYDYFHLNISNRRAAA